MNYSFKCPYPCNYEIKIDAVNDDDAINKMIMAGAIRCRNSDNRCYCENAHHEMPPINDNQLRRIVSLCMCAVDDGGNSCRHFS